MINVLLTYTGLIPSVRFCALEPLKQLETYGKLNLMHKRSYCISKKDLNECDVLVLVRCGESHELRMAQACKKAGRLLVYVLDDDLLNVPEEIDCSDYYSTNIVRNNITEIMSLCDVLWTPNINLAKKYGQFFKKTVLIEEPFIGNFYKKEITNNNVRIGFAGSVSHKAYINEFLGEILKRIKNQHKDNVSIEFFGFKPDFAKDIGARCIPYSDSYENYCKIMRERNWDIGLAPLEESKFTSCKYFNKYIEYSSYGVAGIYSAVEPYTFGIKDGLNGILCDNTVESWVQALNLLIRDKELTKNISEFAQKELLDKFSVRSVAETIYRETGFCTCDKNAVIKYKKIFAVFSKIKVYSEIYGIMMPAEITKKAALKLLNQLKK